MIGSDLLLRIHTVKSMPSLGNPRKSGFGC